MNVFGIHGKIIDDYASYIKSFINISDEEIRSKVEASLQQGKLWPAPLLQFNPSYDSAGTIQQVCDSQNLHRDLPKIFKGYSLYNHQIEAIKRGISGANFIVTSGTGSGKSLTYIASVFNHLLNNPDLQGVVAVIVYPMNALINSQTNEFNLYKGSYERETEKEFPVTFGQYTGQEGEDAREKLRCEPPHILLTNYMMLELLLTRSKERSIRNAIYKNLKFLTFDELHTYRGRQGADVSMLIRRIRAKCRNEICCIGTSATMISVGSKETQQERVAEVGEKIFGCSFSKDNIIEEKLCRSLDSSIEKLSKVALAKAINTDIDQEDCEESLRKNPVAVWLENRVALEEKDGNLVRRRPVDVVEITKMLSEESGLPENLCLEYLSTLLEWISKVNTKIRKRDSKDTILPFKLHQFISQTGSVYTTLDQGENRFITLEPGLYKHDEDKKKPIFPNVFSRATGHAFVCVSLKDDRFYPREFRTYDDDEEATDGYLVIGEDVWNPEEDIESLPESWFKFRKGGIRKPKPEVSEKLPNKIYFDEFGNCSEDKIFPYWGWFMKAPLLFDPTGGEFFEQKTSEATKLTKLGSEGRSTSTTITAFSILNQLHNANFKPIDQKLLSFTDNRQDAALQSGHFNDFVQVVQLRSAIYKALRNAHGNTLTHTNLGESIFKALNLNLADYSTLQQGSDLPFVVRKYEDSFKSFLLFRALSDLRRSWRIILPNLEQCGLLRFEYEYLNEVVESDSLWEDIPLLQELSRESRCEFLQSILEYFRKEYAIHSRNHFDPANLQDKERMFRENLKSPWTLDPEENLRYPRVLRLDTLKYSRFSSTSIGASSSFGKFMRRYFKGKEHSVESLKGGNYRDTLLAILKKLVVADYLVEEYVDSRTSGKVPVFQLKIGKIHWKLGDGENAPRDSVKQLSYKYSMNEVNEFFRDLYKRDLSKQKTLTAADHTGQLSVDLRKDREDRFRAEWKLESGLLDNEKIQREAVSALFCSPTMELGVDIGGLSVVHLRNAPPNPANYAQRSGRAGRNGQGAMIFTYCSDYSAHDRHYFKNRTDLVAGVVQPPSIDLCNEELLHSHLNALVISEVGLPGLDYNCDNAPSISNLLSEEQTDLPMLRSVSEGLKLGAQKFKQVKECFLEIVSDFKSEMTSPRGSWFTNEWVERSITDIAKELDRSLDRWRKTFIAAKRQLQQATKPIESGRLKTSSPEYRKFESLQKQSNRQLNLLRNEQSRFGDFSEFYPYRYLAAEGFLPGYNFTRLPIRVFLSPKSGEGVFISRPRRIALREFGPLNLIYHNGRKYEVQQLVFQDFDSTLSDAKVSTKSGFFFSNELSGAEICPFSGTNLSSNENKELIHDLIEMSESRAIEKLRITCEEEERRSKGFEVHSYFSIDGGDFDKIKEAKVKSSGIHLLNLRFIPSMRLIMINKKWRNRDTSGFPIGTTSGNWKESFPKNADDQSEDFRIVKPHTSITSDALYIEPIEALGLSPNGVTTLEYALKRAIEIFFQIEPGEIGVETMGDPACPNILIYESAEGSLGVLSQFVDDHEIFKDVIEEAIKLCRFDDKAYKAPASYDDLLSFYNQREHNDIDRFLIKDALEKLKIGEVELQTNPVFQDYDEQYQYMLLHLDQTSSTEKKFIEYLYENNLRLPDKAQPRVPGLYCKPDFYFEPRFWVFCDGSPHDREDVRIRDEEQRQLILQRGDEVWSWHYREDLAAKVASRPDIFKRVR